jgi:hypothetical protein
MALGSTQPLTEMSIRNLPGGLRRPARKSHNLTAICEPIVQRKFGGLDVSHPFGPSRTVTGIVLPYIPLVRGAVIVKIIEHEILTDLPLLSSPPPPR